MGFDLKPNNSELRSYHTGAFSWHVYCEVWNFLFPEIHQYGKYLYTHGVDKRYGTKEKPLGTIGTNDGFPITEEESKIMARMLRNWAYLQEFAKPSKKSEPAWNRQEGITKEDFDKMLKENVIELFTGNVNNEFFPKVREDFRTEAFDLADWMEKSKGFKIW